MSVYVVKPCWGIDRSHYPHVLPTKLTIVSKMKVLMLKGEVFKFTSQTKLNYSLVLVDVK